MYAFKPIDFEKSVQAATAQVNLATRAFEPWLRAASRSNLEMVALSARRSRALMDLSSSLLASRTPQDVVRHSGAFWQSAVQDWLEASSRITAVWGAASPMSFAAAWRDPARAAEAGEVWSDAVVSRGNGEHQTPSDERRAA